LTYLKDAGRRRRLATPGAEGGVQDEDMERAMNLKSLIPVGRQRGVARADNPFVSLQQEIDRLFDDFTRGFPAFTAGTSAAMLPTMDVAETDKDIEITAELPGLEEKDVQINVADNVLTIRGEKKAEKEEKDKNYRLVERSYGSFERSLELPRGVNLDAIKASIDKGVLRVTVPKPAPAQVRKVEVKPAA
jgi:HSP20 family protein